MNQSLYTTSEIKAFKELQVKKQKGIDPITGEPFKEPSVMDHCHSSQHCRGALNRNSNAFEGLVTNAYTRCLRWLTDVPLPDLLRNLANYLEVDYSKNPFHSGFMKRLKTDFNKLTSKQQDITLVTLGSHSGKNAKERKELFAKVVLDRNLGYTTIKDAINKVKEV